MDKQSGKAEPALKDLEPRKDGDVKGGTSAISNVMKNISDALQTVARAN
jgi:hypothetical protein